jgi:glycine hydroxymethyltransferase
MKGLLNCSWIDIRPISGTHANLAIFRGLSTRAKNRRMVVAPLSSGAHISHDYTGLAGKIIGLETIDHAYDLNEMNIDPDKSANIIRTSKPGIVTFGGSLFLFPHPIKELKDVAKEVDAYTVYDAAHVLGLIAGEQFQNPFKEGVDFITASTHKTFPGPQGGVVFGNYEDNRMEKAIKSIQQSIFPLTTSNTHLGRLPATGLAALEMKLFGEKLAKQTVKNAKAAGEYFFGNGLEVLGEKKGFTESHQIAIDVQKHGGGKKVAEKLEEANIIVNKNLLPYDKPKDKENPSGIRIGFQDITRRGFKENDVEQLCDLMLEGIKGKVKPLELKKKIITLIQGFNRIEYGFNSIDEALKYVEKHA